MNATDELRRMLDERGVEWRKTPHYSSESQDNETIFEGNGIEWYANDHLNGRLGLRTARYEVTPAQAIAATLGSGTCHLKPWEMERDTGFYDCMECDCGYVADVADWAEWRLPQLRQTKRGGRRMTDTEKAALERRIDELCAEVEALKRDEWSAGFNAGCDAVEAAYEDGKAYYEDENAKLRWLATDMCACFRIGAEREGVSKQWCYELFDTYTRKLRELGIEVDG